LESLSEIAQEGAKVGGYIPVPLDLQEMGLPNLPAQVMSITACPPIASGPGRVVLATVTHLNDDVFHLTLTNARGQSEVIGVTAYHLIYTEDRGWVEASQLRMGEAIQGANGDLTVTGLVQDPGVFQVYNMDVEADHVYYVGNLPALVHNNCPTGFSLLRLYNSLNSQINEAYQTALELTQAAENFQDPALIEAYSNAIDAWVAEGDTLQQAYEQLAEILQGYFP
jgi:hypothetical protein